MKTKRIRVFLAAACTFLLAGCASAADRGAGYLEKNNYSKAAEAFEESVKDKKDLADAWHGLGIAYWELGEYSKSEEAFKKALENGAEENANIYQTLGDCNMQLADYEEALTCYWKGMACQGLTEGQLKEMLYNEIVACENLKDWDNAKMKIAAYVEKYPDDEAALKEAEFLETR